MARRRGCCSSLLHLREENARFLLLAFVMVLYMLAGATVFHYLEYEEEQVLKRKYWSVYRAFWDKYNGTVDPKDVEVLLHEYGNASSAGLINKRPRWDFPGAFYFVGTVVSTIGFGMTTPKTIPGRMAVIIYGFFGCAGGILFFNLFLERIITFLAYTMRAYHEWEIRKTATANGGGGTSSTNRRDSQMSLDDNLDPWKPSVYWVMLCLFVATIVVAASASALYSPVENWSYVDSLYFCFIAFATIGFGDFVTDQELSYSCGEWYRFANFIFMVVGCCCIYSLFNVISIIIKQFLNWLIRKMDVTCRCCSKQRSPVVNHATRKRRNALTPDHLSRHRTLSIKTTENSDADSTYDSDAERRNSGEMICMSDLLRSNKVSLAVMQKELYESAQRGAGYLLPPRRMGDNDTFKPGTVGPLAIVSQKLEESS